MRGRNATKENEEVVIDSRHEAQRLYEKQFRFCTISRTFISIPGIIVLYSFPHILCSKKKRKLPIIYCTILTSQSSPYLCNCLFLLPQMADRCVERYYPIIHNDTLYRSCGIYLYKDIPISNWEESRSKLTS
jgi:hypothetical protein